MKRLRTPRFTLLALCATTVLAACSGAEAPPPPAAPAVGVVTIAPVSLPIVAELPGRVEASRVAEVRARAAGIVLKREFSEGSEVKAGERLFLIDPAPLRAAHSSAAAGLARAQASLNLAQLKAQRYQPLVGSGAISKQEYDDSNAARELAEADVALAAAAVETARLNLGYATVTAPISGRIGRAEVTEGALVGQGDATLLATIQQIDPLYVNLSQSSAELLRLQRSMASGQTEGVGAQEARVVVIAEDGQEHPQRGRLLFSDVSVDPSTGAVALRVEIPNPGRALLPGMYVRARLEQAVAREAITVPQQAVVRAADGASVWVVGAEDKAERRSIKVVAARDDQWVVSEGLAAGERVVVDGLQRVQAGAAVTPVPWPQAAAAAAPAGRAAAP